jgi:hypothetical protein
MLTQSKWQLTHEIHFWVSLVRSQRYSRARMPSSDSTNKHFSRRFFRLCWQPCRHSNYCRGLFSRDLRASSKLPYSTHFELLYLNVRKLLWLSYALLLSLNFQILIMGWTFLFQRPRSRFLKIVTKIIHAKRVFWSEIQDFSYYCAPFPSNVITIFDPHMSSIFLSFLSQKVP